jgi:hypothetical protein
MGAQGGSLRGAHRGSLRVLVGAGNKIGLATLPFLVVGLALNVATPRRSRSADRPHGSDRSRSWF